MEALLPQITRQPFTEIDYPHVSAMRSPNVHAGDLS